MTTTVENNVLMHALAYAEMGWRVFPIHHPIWRVSKCFCSCGEDCPSPGKHPHTEHGLKDATDDQRQIKKWWTICPLDNVGIATGSVSGVFVLDVDGDAGRKSLGALMEEFGELPETMEVETGGGGSHIFFKYPESAAIKNSASKLGDHLDIRGDGGYVVAAPSRHVSGKDYAWVNGWPDGTIADAPKWMIDKLAEAPKLKTESPAKPLPDTATHWLGRALALSVNGKRNETGFWLACQLRDAGITMFEASATMRAYAQRTPPGDKPYTEGEAITSLASAYSQSAREPTDFQKRQTEKQNGAGQHVGIAPVQKTENGAAAELGTFINRIIGREVYNIPWPGNMLTEQTQALLPGTITCICSDPGMGKTFLVLQCLQFWKGNGFEPAVFFIEKDRRFHTQRLLAQLESNGNLTDFAWIADHGDEARAASERWKETINELGSLIYSSPAERATTESLLGWIRQMASAGKNPIVVDPITAISAGDNRWIKDEQFIVEGQQIMTAHESRLILITHAKKGNRPQNPTGHDMAGGSAYHRFTDTTIWLVREKKPKDVKVITAMGPAQMRLKTFLQIHKARHGRGSGKTLGYIFGEGLKFAEQGIVVDEKS